MGIRRHVLAKGAVQGVFFRIEVQSLANELGITGWIKNLPDGDVEAVFEGGEDLVMKMVQFCKKGPIGSKVEELVIKEEKFTGEFKDFKIIYQE
jgi:acylphosphatase